MQILAHRGLLKAYPENSMQALMSAVHSNLSLETDLRLTNDGDFLLIHDETFERLAGKNVRVADMSLPEATTYTYANTTTNFISLRQLLDELKTEVKHPVIAFHLKTDSQNDVAFRKLSEYWKTYDLYNQAFIFDLTIDAARQCKTIDPQIRIASIVSEYKFEPTVYLWDEVKNDPNFDIVWAAEYRTLYTQEMIWDMQKTKGQVYAMSPDVHGALGHPLAQAGYETTWETLIKLNVNGICTDEAIKLAQFYKQTTS